MPPKDYKDDNSQSFFADLVMRKVAEDLGIKWDFTNPQSSWNNLTSAEQEHVIGRYREQETLEVGYGDWTILDSLAADTGQWYERDASTGEAYQMNNPPYPRPNYYENPKHAGPSTSIYDILQVNGNK